MFWSQISNRLKFNNNLVFNYHIWHIMPNNIPFIIDIYRLLALTLQTTFLQFLIQGITINSLQETKSKFPMNFLNCPYNLFCNFLVQHNKIIRVNPCLRILINSCLIV